MSLLRKYLDAFGFRGVARPADENIVYPLIDIPLTLTNAGTTRTLNGANGTPLVGPGAWIGDVNLNQFMPSTGRFFLIFDKLQFRVDVNTVVPAEVSGINQVVQGLALVHSPKVGSKPYTYPAIPGVIFDQTITALAFSQSDPVAAANSAAGMQSGDPGMRDIGFPLALDLANDTLQVTYPVVAAAPATFPARLQFSGFAISYDGNETVGEEVRSRGPLAVLDHRINRRISTGR